MQSDKDGVRDVCEARHPRDPREVAHDDERHRHEYDTQFVIELFFQVCQDNRRIRRRIWLHARNRETVVEQKLKSGVKVESRVQITHACW